MLDGVKDTHKNAQIYFTGVNNYKIIHCVQLSSVIVPAEPLQLSSQF
jgi:hypothetical protein